MLSIACCFTKEIELGNKIIVNAKLFLRKHKYRIMYQSLYSLLTYYLCIISDCVNCWTNKSKKNRISFMNTVTFNIITSPSNHASRSVPNPRLWYTTDDMDAAIVAALITAHYTTHAPNVGQTAWVEKVKRTSISAARSSEEWAY